MQPAGLVAGLRLLPDIHRRSAGSLSRLDELSEREIGALCFLMVALGSKRQALRPVSSASEIFTRFSIPSNNFLGCRPRNDLRGGGKSSSSSDCRRVFFRGILWNCQPLRGTHVFTSAPIPSHPSDMLVIRE